MSRAWQSDTPLILASASASRRALLDAAGLVFAVQPSGVFEDDFKRASRASGGDASDAAIALSEAKARAVAPREPHAIAIGADQILTCDEHWFDKPADLAEAADQLRQLRGRRQILHTAVTLVSGDKMLWQHVVRPVLRMRDFSDQALALYLEAEGMGLLSSVGACRIEGIGQMLFADIEGEHSAILGLPMLALLDALRRAGALIR